MGDSMIMPICDLLFRDLEYARCSNCVRYVASASIKTCVCQSANGRNTLDIYDDGF